MTKRSNCILTSYRISPAEPQNVPCGGTAVFIVHREQLFLCTVRHTIDRGYANPRCSLPKAEAISLIGFFKINDSYLDVRTIRLDGLDWIADENGHDFAVCTHFDREKFGSLVPSVFSTDYFAVRGGNWMEPRADIGCNLFYSGYPDAIVAHGQNQHPLVTRQGILACDLRDQIDVPEVIGKNYGLVDSFAQKGFSGAPLWSSVSPKSVTLPACDTGSGEHRQVTVQSEPEQKFLGLICGHYRSNSDLSNGTHSGLSYFVKCDLIEQHLERVANP